MRKDFFEIPLLYCCRVSYPLTQISYMYARGNSLYIFMGILNSIPMMWIYHYKDDMLWGVVLKYAFDLWLSMRIRIPDPFDAGNSEKEANTENQKYWDRFWLPIRLLFLRTNCEICNSVYGFIK